MRETDILIVGAGITGLKLASEALRRNKSCLVLEKSRGVGGRLATRRIEDLGLDHGSPVDPSSPNSKIMGGINKIPKALAADLDIKKSTRVINLEQRDSKWIAHSESGELFSGIKLILTCPAPQALELLKASHLETASIEELEKITYDKAVMSLFITQEEDLTPHQSSNAAVHSLLSMKERALHPRGWVLRMSESESDKLFELDQETIIKSTKKEFMGLFPTAPTITHQELMKWRYAVPKTTLPGGFIEALPGLFVAGDGFQGDPLVLFSLNNF